MKRIRPRRSAEVFIICFSCFWFERSEWTSSHISSIPSIHLCSTNWDAKGGSSGWIRWDNWRTSCLKFIEHFHAKTKTTSVICLYLFVFQGTSPWSIPWNPLHHLSFFDYLWFAKQKYKDLGLRKWYVHCWVWQIAVVYESASSVSSSFQRSWLEGYIFDNN